LYIIAIIAFKCGGREEIGEKTTLPPHWLVDHACRQAYLIIADA
jgi:hypothetical protein